MRSGLPGASALATGAQVFAITVIVGCGAHTAQRQGFQADGRTISGAELDAANRAYLRECSRASSPEQDVEIEDGVDRCEAMVLAEQHTGPIGCGGVGSPLDFGMYWLLPVKEGAAGVFTAPVRVDKRTGVASRAPVSKRGAAP